MNSSSRGPRIVTYTGKQFFFQDPKLDDICIEDIAHALSRTCRYGGHCIPFYSVAQHSTYVAYCVNTLSALMHDASEAYLVDLPRPLKSLFPQYYELEDKISRVISEKFKLDYPWSSEIKEFDNRLLMTEKRDLLIPSKFDWEISEKPIETRIEPWSSDKAEQEFLQAFQALSK